MTTQHFMIEIAPDDRERINGNSSRPGRDLTIQNLGPGYAYIGDNNVTANNFGYKLAPNSAIAFELDWRDNLYAATANAIGEDTTLAILSVSLERIG